MPRHLARHLLSHLVLITVTGGAAVALSGCQYAAAPPLPVASELSGDAWPSGDDDVNPEVVADHAARLISRYLAVTDAITQAGGENPGRMVTVTTAAWFPIEETAFARYRTQGLRTIGDTEFDSLVVQSVSTSHTGDMHVDAIVCVDARWVWLLPHDADDPPEGLVEWLRSGDNQDISDEDVEQWSEYLELVQPVPGDREAIVVWMVGADVGSLAIDGTVNWEGAHSCHTTEID